MQDQSRNKPTDWTQKFASTQFFSLTQNLTFFKLNIDEVTLLVQDASLLGLAYGVTLTRSSPGKTKIKWNYLIISQTLLEQG